ncbi:unnamed protein product [Closterium sp. NIES-53]
MVVWAWVATGIFYATYLVEGDSVAALAQVMHNPSVNSAMSQYLPCAKQAQMEAAVTIAHSAIFTSQTFVKNALEKEYPQGLQAAGATAVCVPYAPPQYNRNVSICKPGSLTLSQLFQKLNQSGSRGSAGMPEEVLSDMSAVLVSTDRLENAIEGIRTISDCAYVKNVAQFIIDQAFKLESNLQLLWIGFLIVGLACMLFCAAMPTYAFRAARLAPLGKADGVPKLAWWERKQGGGDRASWRLAPFTALGGIGGSAMNGGTFSPLAEGEGSAGDPVDHRFRGRLEMGAGALGGSLAEASAEDDSSGGRSAEDERPLIAPSERKGGAWAEGEAQRTSASMENGWDDSLRKGGSQEELRHEEGAAAGEVRGDGDREGAERLRGGGALNSTDVNGCAEAGRPGSAGGGGGEVGGGNAAEIGGGDAGRGGGEAEELIRAENDKSEEERGEGYDRSGNGIWVDEEKALRDEKAAESAGDPSADGGAKGNASGDESESSRRTADGERSFVWLLNVPLEAEDDVEEDVEVEDDDEDWEDFDEGEEGAGGEAEGEEGAADGEDGGAAAEGTTGRRRSEGSRSSRGGGGGGGAGGRAGGAENTWRALEGHEDKFVDLQRLFVGPKFATGTYGRLYQGLYEGQDVAIKILRPPDSEGEAEKLAHQFKQEVDLLARLDHPNVVRFIGACQRPPTWCILTEYLGGGSLRGFLQKREGQLLPLQEVVRLALDIARGMAYLHAEGVVHRDLKPDNLVLTTDTIVKITDFGVARLEADTSLMTAETGTYRWMAPEVVDHRPYTKNVDVYSFGIVLWELCTVQLPFAGMTAMQAAFAVVNRVGGRGVEIASLSHNVIACGHTLLIPPPPYRLPPPIPPHPSPSHPHPLSHPSQGIRPDIPPSIPLPLAELMQVCWHSNADRRPPFTYVVQQLEAMQDALSRDPNALPLQASSHHRAQGSSSASAAGSRSPRSSSSLFCCC